MGALRVEVLGSFRLVLNGAPSEVGRRQVRVLLGRLAADPGPVSRDALVELLWGDRLPADPAGALRVALTRTRAALGEFADSLVASGGMYELHAECDALEFAPAVDDLQSRTHALDLWRGDPFVDLGDAEWFRLERERLIHARRVSIKGLIASLWAEEEFSDVERFGRDSLTESPGDEVVASFVAMACARLGRQAEGLQIIDGCRAVLRDRGLVLSTALADLEGEILRGAVEFAIPDLADESDASGAFVGRSAELAAISAALGSGRSVAVVGEAGIGKSLLVDIARERVAGQGNPVVVVAASSAAERPLQTLATLASEAVDQVGEQTVSARHSGALARVIPEWESSTAQADPPTDRDDLVARLVDFIATSIAGTTVIVDDWHWIDAVSAQGLVALLRTGACPMVITSRPIAATGVVSVPDLAAVADEMIMVGPLDHGDVHELLGKDFPAVPNVVVDRIVGRAGGNPLFVRLLADLVSEGTDIGESLPTTALVAIKARLAVLSAPAQQVVQHAAVLGPEADLDVLIDWVGDGTITALREAEAAGIVRLDMDAGLCTFVHSLIADGADQLLAEAQRVALHDDAGRRLETAGSSPAGYVRHCVAAAELDPHRAFSACVEASELYVNAFSWHEALHFASFAISLHDRGLVDDVALGRVLLVKGRCLFALGEAGSYDVLLHCVRSVGSEPNDHEVFVAAATELCHHGSIVLSGQEPAPLLAALDAALDMPVSKHHKARLLAASARLLAYSKDHVRGQTLYKQALAQFDEIDDALTKRSIMRHAEHGLSNPEDHDFACEFLDTLLNDGLGDPELVNHVRWFQFQRAVIDADVDTLSEAPEHSRRRDEKGPRTASYVLFGQTTGQSMQSHWVQSSIAVLAGEIEMAERHADAALQAGMAIVEARGDGLGKGTVLGGYGSLQLAIRAAQGRLGDLRPIIEMAIASSPELPAWRAALCAVAHAEGDVATATKILKQLTKNDFADLPPDIIWTSAMWLLAKPTADLASDDSCKLLYDLMLPYQDRMSFTGFASLGPMHAALAVLATRLGQLDAAATHEQRATEITQRLRTISLT